MSTKKNLFLTILLFSTFIFNKINAQGIFLELTTGYALPLSEQSITMNDTYNDYVDGSYSYDVESVYGSFGKGTNFGLNLGYMFNANLGIELQGNYLMSAKYSGKYISTFEYLGNNNTTTFEEVYQANMLRVIPTIIFEIPGKTFTPYAHLGFAMGLGRISLNSTSVSTSGDISEREFTYNDGISFGSAVELGLKYGLTEKLSISAGITAIGMNYSPKRGEITKYTENGVDMLSQLSTSEREYEFVDEYSGNSEDYNSDEPSEILVIHFPFSSFGLNIGFRYSF